MLLLSRPGLLDHWGSYRGVPVVPLVRIHLERSLERELGDLPVQLGHRESYLEGPEFLLMMDQSQRRLERDLRVLSAQEEAQPRGYESFRSAGVPQGKPQQLLAHLSCCSLLFSPPPFPRHHHHQ